MTRARLLPALLLLLAAPAAAQQPAQAGVPANASPLLEPGHWAVHAARRLESLGLLPPTLDPHAGSLPLAALAEALASAESAATAEAPHLLPLLHAWRNRLQEEFAPLLPAPTDVNAPANENAPANAPAPVNVNVPVPVHVHAPVALAGFLGYAANHGAALAGIDYDNQTDWTGARPAPDLSSALAGLSVHAIAGRHLAAALTPIVDEDGLALETGHITAVWRGIGAWAGRRAIAYGPGTGGAIVFGGVTPLDGGGLYLARPTVLPSVLRWLGPVGAEAFLARVTNGDRIRHPLLWGVRVAARPHGRLRLAAQRGVMFGGEGNTDPGLRDFLYMLIGKHAGESGELDNQVFSASASWRPPLGRALPLLAWIEWGMDDSAGAWRDVPAIIAGAELAAVPGVPALALGVERAYFARSCCGNTAWYRNWSLRGGWTDDGRVLGHPLGGHGTEWLVSARADFDDARLRARAAAFTRDRGAENLVAPERAGRSRGAAIDARWRPAAAIELAAAAAFERGDAGWDSSSLTLTAWWFR